MREQESSRRPDVGRLRRLVLTVATSATLGASIVAPAQAAVIESDDPGVLAAGMSSVPVAGAALDAAPAPPYPNGIGDAALAGFPTNGPNFTILTTGDVTFADQPNTSESTGANLSYNNASRGDANDPTTLALALDVPQGSTCLAFDYKFLSEEFPEFVGSQFNDAFIAELDTSNWSAAGQTLTAPNDFAAPVGTQISVNSIGPTAVSAANSAGTTYDAGSPLVTTKTPVTPGVHGLYLSIFDASDHIFDSAVFLDNLRYTADPPKKCRPPDIFGGLVGVKVLKVANVVNGKAVFPITCNLPIGATIPCTINITLKVNAGALISKKVKIGSKKGVQIQPSQKKKVKVKLSRAAKRTVNANGKLKVKAIVKNRTNGVKKTFKVKLKD